MVILSLTKPCVHIFINISVSIDSSHTKFVDRQVNESMRIISGSIKSIPM